MKLANIVRLKDRLLVYPQSMTDTGLWVATEPYTRLPLGCDPSVIGQATLSALACSGDSLPHPKDWRAHGAPRLAAAGVRSERAFHSRSSLVSVTSHDDGYAVEPHINGGTAGDEKGFRPVPDGAIRVALQSTPDVLGSAVIAALSVCRGPS